MTVLLFYYTNCDQKNGYYNQENIDYTVHFDEETFMSNWEMWNNQNIKNYSYTLI